VSTADPGTAHGQVSDCKLDAPQLAAQLSRYRQLGQHATSVERLTREVLVRFEHDLPADLLERTLAVERGCCPFFRIACDPGDRRLTIAVEKIDQDPRLDSLFHALNSHGTVSSACCEPETLKQCCEPAAKEGCCGSSGRGDAPGSCGCQG
jgi:hypothetical protein